MKRKVFKCSLLLCLLPLFSMAGNDGEKASKTVSREFNIRTDGRVELLNKYGNMDIAIGESNKVKIDVVMTATAGSEKKARENLDRISVDFEEGSNRVRAQTNIESESGGWLSWFGGGNVDLDIHYEVRVPADVFLELRNKFGNIYVETSDRDIEIELGYGNLRLGDINAKLKLDMAYSDGSISQIGDGDMELSYSDLEMEDGRNVSLDMKFTDVVSGTFQKLKLVSAYSNLHAIAINQMDYEGKYDDIVLEEGNNLNANTGFTNIKVQEFKGHGDFEMRYGELKIQKIHRGFSRIDINTSYTGVTLEFNPDASFSIDAETNYSDIIHTGLKVTENTVKTTNHVLKASRGSGASQVVARMNYGELRIQ